MAKDQAVPSPETRMRGFELALDELRAEVRKMAVEVERLRLGHSASVSPSGMTTLGHPSTWHAGNR